MKMLIENGADVNQANKFNKIPLHDAILKDAGFESVKILIENGSNVNTRIGSNCFDSFEREGAVGFFVRERAPAHGSLLENGANPKDGNPLILACQESHFDVAALLLKHGVDVNKYDYTDSTALQYVVSSVEFENVTFSCFCYVTSNYKKNITRISGSYRAGKSLENQRLNAHLIV